MTKKKWLLWGAYMTGFASPLLMDYALNTEHQNLTYSEITRDLTVELPHGKTMFSLVWFALGVAFWKHIVSRAKNPNARW